LKHAYPIFRFKRTTSPYRIVATSYIIFAFWMIARLMTEICWYTIKNYKALGVYHYKALGVYLVLGILITLFTTLIVIVQKKLHAKQGVKQAT
jgi:hypothetical protein